ncbi:Sensor histidine kinase TmoS [Bradyrhizobium ivorense]|uniref:histidine kinase n=1 Tax=Bradyrhizobium ivorense TaxID=2511166 RepID=A0A508TCR1_9BRAD|nr:ATP-binding protein [Bradyrhizobium ivorense]MCC8935005.1 GAF domain-containing protein [Bradyrhizobium ivorense]VIO72803.1 Sensor histidine kinase TmoS [Bradyrhizobium ivorense]
MRPRVSSRSELEQQVAELVAQQAAVSEVLRAIARSPSDLQPIFDAILDSAARLCRGDLGSLRLFEKEGFRLVAIRGNPDLLKRWRVPDLVDHGSYVGALAASRIPSHIPDLAVHEAYHRGEPLIRGVVDMLGVRTMLVVPMFKDDDLIGTINLGRIGVRPYTNKEIALFTDFAAQASIALESTRRERQYRELQHELARANRVAILGQLAASIAHELKQPLTSVVASGDAGLRWLAKQPPGLEEARRSIERVLEGALRGGGIITGLQGLTKKQPSRREPLDINSAIQEVAVLTHGEAIKHGVSVRTRLASSLPHIQGDRLQLQQVLLNLFVNAIQAMSGISSGRRELQVSTESVAEGVRVGVRDTGPGLPPECPPRLFEPFYTTKADGMGMGLAICRSIVEAHGGRLSATRCEPDGALFQFTIPADRDEMPGDAVVDEDAVSGD